MVQIHFSLKYIADNQSNINFNLPNKYDYTILIPVLREQQIIKQTFDRFTTLNSSYNVVFITTEKEKYDEGYNLKDLKNKLNKLVLIENVNTFIENLIGIFTYSEASHLFLKILNLDKKSKESIIIETFLNRESTQTILLKLANSLSKKKQKNVKIIHYPKIDGNMAHQLNYALQKLTEIKKQKSKKSFTLVYNADSVVSKNLIPVLNSFLNLHSEAKVVLQSALYLHNYHTFDGFWKQKFLQDIALLQTRWTLAHEIPRILIQQTQFGNLLEGGHVVGHGLCIQTDVLLKIGGFPENFTNEDLPLGYLLRLQNYKVYSLPLLENADSPTTIKNVFRQYTTWFYGIFNYPLYIQHALSLKEVSKFKAIVWGLKYMIRGLLWFGLSLSWLYLFLYPLVTLNFINFGLAILIYCFYAPLSFLYIVMRINSDSSLYFGEKKQKMSIDFINIIMTMPVYLTHSYPTWVAIYKTIYAYIFKENIIKQKTER